jgi:hypothetical protein
MSATQIFDNLDIIKEKLLKYEKMKAHLKKGQKKYQQTHPEKIREISKRYYDKKKIEKEVQECIDYFRSDCGPDISLDDFLRIRKNEKKVLEIGNLPIKPDLPQKRNKNYHHLKRYHEDPEYRAKILERDRVRYHKIKEKKALEKANLLKET